MNAESELARRERFDELYAQYVKPLEQEHTGEYAAVSPDGSMVLASTLPDVLKHAAQTFQSDSFVFKIGDVTVDKLGLFRRAEAGGTSCGRAAGLDRSGRHSRGR